MDMFRAVPKDNFEENVFYKQNYSRRLPTNVPYLIDNIWEWLRQPYAPSRRHAVYASPTPELALENASSLGSDKSKYIVCKINNFIDIEKVAHLNIKDARYHSDIQNLVRCVNKNIGKSFGDLNIDEKIIHAPLFLPGVSKEELEKYFKENNLELSKKIKEISTFWNDINFSIQKHNGELFFELPLGGYYELKSKF